MSTERLFLIFVLALATITLILNIAEVINSGLDIISMFTLLGLTSNIVILFYFLLRQKQ